MSRALLAVLAALTLAAVGGCSGTGSGGLDLARLAPAAGAGSDGFEPVSDTEIRLQINYLWAKHDLALFRKINLSVKGGRVMLTGSVINPKTRVDAVRLAWQAEGVQEVINEILVDDPATLIESARDHWITARLRARLMLDPEVGSDNFNIDAVGGAVYVMGLARDQEELDRVIAHAKNVDYVENVVSHVRLRPPKQAAQR